MLQGHCNPICGLATNPSRTLVVSADIGPDSMVIIWDAHTGEPLQTIPCPTPYGFRSIDMSPDGSMIAVVTAPPAQQVHIWELGPSKSGGILASHVAAGVVRPDDTHRMIAFSCNRTLELVSQGRKSIAFWAPHPAAPERLVMSEPTLAASDFNQSVGEFTMSSFIPGTSLACTGTVDGDLIVWSPKEGAREVGDRIATKMVRLHNAPLTFVTTVGNLLVTGGAEGFVRLFDSKLRITAWFEEINAGHITSIAFAGTEHRPMGRLSDIGTSYATHTSDAAAPLSRLDLPDFVVSTSKQAIVHVSASSFEDRSPPRPIMQGVTGQITSLAAHPRVARVALCTRAGRVEVWDWSQHQMVSSAALPSGLLPYTLRFSRTGGLLIVGCVTGHTFILDGASLRETASLRNTREAIVHADMNLKSDCLVIADAEANVILYSKQRSRGVLQWDPIGKYKGPAGGIAGVMFCERTVKGRSEEILVACGADASIIEFDLGACSLANGIALSERTKPPNTFPGEPVTCVDVRGEGPGAVPLCAHQGPNTSFICADSTLKLRVVDVDSGRVMSTVLGPTFGGNVKLLRAFNAQDAGTPCLAYATEEKVCGIIVGPLDGCPEKTLGVIAHPGPISGLAVAHDGSRIFTASAEDPIVNVWRVAPEAAAAMGQRGGEVADWAGAIEGGLDGELMQEMLDTFYYCQVLAQQDPTLQHVPGKIPSQLVVNFLISLGVFISDKEMKQINREFRDGAKARHGDAYRAHTQHVSFEELVRIFVNHRPVGGVLQQEVEGAFRDLQKWVIEPHSDDEDAPKRSSMRARSPESRPGMHAERSGTTSTAQPQNVHRIEDLPEDMVASGSLFRHRIVEALEKYGEKMDAGEQAQVAQKLLGLTRLQEAIPEVCNPADFMEQVLGFVRD